MNFVNYVLSDPETLSHRPWLMCISEKLSHRMFVGPLVLGSCLSGLMIFFWWSVGIFDFLHNDQFTPNNLHYAGQSVFFSIAIGYMIGSCAHLTNRAVAYIDALRPHLPRFSTDDGANAALKIVIKRVPRNAWVLCTSVGIGFGLVLAFAYAVPTEPRFKEILAEPRNYTVAQIALPFHAILCWGLIFQVFFCLIKNSVIFSELGKEVRIDLLNLGTLKPFGHVASNNTATIIVGLALMPLLWLDEPKEVWIDIVGVVVFVLPATAAIFWLPIHQVRKRIRDAKIWELKRIQRAIGGDREVLADCSIAADADRFRLPELLSW